MSGPRGYYTKRNKTGRKTNAIGFDSCGIKKTTEPRLIDMENNLMIAGGDGGGEG